jgi:mannose-6-phosphate isomerase
VELDRRGPQVLLCTAGDATVTADGSALRLRPGEAAFVAAAAHRLGRQRAPAAEVFRATVGDG